MSEQHSPWSTAPGHYGIASSSRLTLQETRIAAAWNLQGDGSDAAFTDQAMRSFGIAQLPGTNGTVRSKAVRAFWLGPGSWLLLAGSVPGEAHPLRGFPVHRDAFNAVGGALFDLSASRIGWRVAGPMAFALLSSGCPLDLHPRAFAPGTCAQSLFGHVGALYWRDMAGDFHLFVARSLARDAWEMLCATGAQFGYDVLAPTTLP